MSSDGGVGDDIRQFLKTRRARLKPQDVGLPVSGRRRVQGLRREEVAMLAGISVEYYNRLERGNAGGVSDQVVASLARALRLDDVERSHLIALTGAATSPSRQRERRPDHRVRPAVQQLLNTMTGAAAFVRTDRLDVLAANQLGRALYSPVYNDAVAGMNLARFIFLSGVATRFYQDCNRIAHAAVGSLRATAGHHPGDRALAALIDELSARSDRFRTLWQDHDVEYYRTGVQRFHHPVVGDVELDYDALEIAADPGLTLVAYTARPDSDAEHALVLLANQSTATPAG